MDLEVKDVAQLLNVSEKTVYEWASKKMIPSYKLNDQVRFSKPEIEAWLLNFKLDKNKNDKIHDRINIQGKTAERIIAQKIGTQAYCLFRAIYKGFIINNINGDTKEDIIRSSVKVIAKNLSLDAEVLTELLLDREKLMPTALNHGVAVPHTRDFLLPKSYDIVAIVYLNKPVEYGALDGQKVKTLFFLFACDDRRHLNLLAKIAYLTRNEDSLNFINQHPGKTHLLNYIKKWETKLGFSHLNVK